MKFGPVPTDQAMGAILAHSIKAGATKLRKGTKLGSTELETLRSAGITEIVAATMEPGDLGEDAAAAKLAKQLITANITASAPFTGRVNLFADIDGLLEIDAASVNALNAVDEAITLATLPNLARVTKGQMIATIKIIPYGVPKSAVPNCASPFQLHPFKRKTASLILTRTQALTDKVLTKGRNVIATRAHNLGLELTDETVTDHDPTALADAIKAAKGEIILILGASATSDRADTCPAGVVAAGGEITRFGMPVDPGNLLFLGHKGSQIVLGLPGCARSPVLNGADWVLERLVAGREVTSSEIGAMGVGGLLKENPKRPQPREAKAASHHPDIAIILLAAGASKRMRGGDKLLEPVEDAPLILHLAKQAISSKAKTLHVVLRPNDTARQAALEELSLNTVAASDWESGMSASIRAGLNALPQNCDGAIIALSDMPEITQEHFNHLIAAFSPSDGREIIRAASASGKPGHPVLFGRRFFESLKGLSGDRGARELLQEMQDFTHEIRLTGQAATTDLDTPEDWAAWRKSQ